MNEIEIGNHIIKAIDRGNKLLICGNGGSAAEAQHFAGELVGKFEYDRRALPALALTTDTSVLTAWANDHSFDEVFSRQIEALGKAGDVLIALSTSGRSANCLQALATAKRLGIFGIDFPRVGRTTPEIQEYQLRAIHQVCRIVERHYLDPSPPKLRFYDDGCSTQIIREAND